MHKLTSFEHRQRLAGDASCVCSLGPRSVPLQHSLGTGAVPCEHRQVGLKRAGADNTLTGSTSRLVLYLFEQQGPVS